MPHLKRPPVSPGQDKKKQNVGTQRAKRREKQTPTPEKKIETHCTLFKNCTVQLRSHFPTRLSVHTFTYTA